METIIFTHATQDSTFTNTRASLHGDVLHCGDYNFVLAPVYPFLNVLNTAGTGPYTLDLYSADISVCA
jgi:glycogen synthase